MEYPNRAVFFMNGNGYKTFVPAKLPPDPPIQFDLELQNLLSLADRKLGRLDGITQILPNPELFVAMYVRKEAVLSGKRIILREQNTKKAPPVLQHRRRGK